MEPHSQMLLTESFVTSPGARERWKIIGENGLSCSVYIHLLASRLSPEMRQSKVRLLVGPEPLYKAMALKKVSP